MTHPTARPARATATTRARLAVVVALLATALLGAHPTQADAYAMKAPSGLTAAAASPTTLTVTWNASSKAKRYRLQYSTSSTMSKARYQRDGDTISTLDGLKPGTTYYVKVRVIDGDGDNLTSYSKAVKVRTTSRDAVPLLDPLRVASYNIKCANCFAGDPNEGTWVQRRQAVVDTILSQRLDVVGLQEASQGWLKDATGKPVSLAQFEDLRNHLGGSWRLTNSHRNNCVRSSTPSGCRYKDQGASNDAKIIYDTSRVQLLDEGSKQLPFVSPDDNERYVAWAELRQRSTGNRFMLATTHLEGTKDLAGSTAYYDLRRAQTQVAVAEVAKHNPDHLPVVFTGDLNSSRFARTYSPANGPYDVLVQAGLVDPLGLAFGTTTTAPGATVGRRINTWVDSFNEFKLQVNGHRSWVNGSYIDYVFVSPSIQVPEWETVVNMDANGQFVGTIPSDHNMVRASLVLPATS